MPTSAMGEHAQPAVDGLQANLSRLHGAKNAGGSVVHPVTVNDDGSPVPFNMVEHLSPTNVDGLFVNQNKKGRARHTESLHHANDSTRRSRQWDV